MDGSPSGERFGTRSDSYVWLFGAKTPEVKLGVSAA